MIFFRIGQKLQEITGSNKYMQIKGLSQIPPGPCTASKNGCIGHFRTAPGRLPSDFSGAGTILTTRTGSSVSKTLLPILPTFY